MSEKIPVNLLKEGKIDKWNQWKSENQDKQRLSFTISSKYFDVEQISKENSTNLVLRDVDLSNTYITLENVELRNCNLTHSVISIENNYGHNIIQIEDCNLENAEFNFNRYSSKGSDEIQLNCISCNFSCSDLTMYLFDQENCISFIDCNFTESSINIAENNSNSNEWSIDFSGCNFTNTDFCSSYFNYANLKGANLSTVKFDNIIYGDVYLTGADLTDANLTGADLTDANLTDANLTDANLTDADLTDADLTGANLTNANLIRADLRGTILSEDTTIDDKWRLVWDIVNHSIQGRDLINADLSDANLSGANLTGANLTGVNLSGANLSGANLTDANLEGIITDENTVIEIPEE